MKKLAQVTALAVLSIVSIMAASATAMTTGQVLLSDPEAAATDPVPIRPSQENSARLAVLVIESLLLT